jgi:hypothetical protein
MKIIMFMVFLFFVPYTSTVEVGHYFCVTKESTFSDINGRLYPAAFKYPELANKILILPRADLPNAPF